MDMLDAPDETAEAMKEVIISDPAMVYKLIREFGPEVDPGASRIG